MKHDSLGEPTTMQTDPTCYVGQVERDPAGDLWAVLYRHDEAIARVQVRSLRQGKRRVTDMVLAAADAAPVPAELRPVPDRNTPVRDTPARPRATPAGTQRWRTAPAE